jgi:hypothetical protein
MFKKLFLTFLAVALCVPLLTNAQGLNKKLAGKMLLQVEDKGRIWYVSPKSYNRMEVTFANALPLFEGEALGITNADLSKIPVDPQGYGPLDDSDLDGYTNREEIIAGYNPFGEGRLSTDVAFGKKLSGKLLLQVEDKGRIWYVDFDGERWEITWNNLMNVFEKLSLGITNENLGQIPAGEVAVQLPTVCQDYTCLHKKIEQCVPGEVTMEYQHIPYIFDPIYAYEQTFVVTIFGPVGDGDCKADFHMQDNARNVHAFPSEALWEMARAEAGSRDLDFDARKVEVENALANAGNTFSMTSKLCVGTAAEFKDAYDYESYVSRGYIGIKEFCTGTQCVHGDDGLVCETIQRWDGELPQ